MTVCGTLITYCENKEIQQLLRKLDNMRNPYETNILSDVVSLPLFTFPPPPPPQRST